MNQVLLYLPLWNSKHPGQLIGGHPYVGQKIDDALTECALGRQHVLYGNDSVKEKPDDRSRLSTNCLKSCALKGCRDSINLSESVSAFINALRVTHWAGPSLVF